MKKNLTFIVCVMLALAAAAPAAAEHPLIVAHRGASHGAPENTLAAFNLAWQQDADAIEGDFFLTSDGHIVCIHDNTTEELADRTLTVAESTLSELRSLDVGSWKDPKWAGEKIPTIDEVLSTVPVGKKIFIEVKCGPEIADPLKEAIERSGLRIEQISVIAFDEEVIAAIKQRLPNCKSFWLTDFKQDKTTGAWSPSVEEILVTLRKIGADGLDCRAHELIDRQFVVALKEADMSFNVWTVDDLETAARMIRLGVDSITTNCPGWLKRTIRIALAQPVR